MKFLTILSFLISFNCFSQDTLTSYFDEDWERTTKEKAHYYRKAFKNAQKKWAVLDYYINGKLQMSGTFLSKKLKKENGTFKYYHENGTISSTGNYRRGKRTGKWVEFFKSGKKDSEGEYKKGKMNGTWTFFYRNGNVSAKEIYKKDKLLNLRYWDKLGNEEKGDLKLLIFPEFVGGTDSLLAYLKNQTVYPDQAKNSNISGKAYINFIIDEHGNIENPRIIRSVHPLLDNEALRIVKQMPKWIPGKQHNRLTKVSFNLPINFILR